MSKRSANRRHTAAAGNGAGRRGSAILVSALLCLGGQSALAAVQAPAAMLPKTLVQGPSSFAPLVEAVRPAVVTVRVQGRQKVAAQVSPDMQPMPFPEFFHRFFGHRPGGRTPPGPAPGSRGLGSGFLVSAEGHVVTSYHVIQQAEEVEVILDDGRELKATVWGVDPKTDLALLKLDTDEALPFLEFGDSGSARTGDWVVAIGNPFGLGGTVTTGIISARGRDIRSGPYDDYLQIDAPINRGNSGGPLFDAQGRVIGVNTAIYSPNGGNVGIGFAVPATQAQAVVDELLENRSVTRGWLGVQIQSLDRELAEALGLEQTGGALVAQVMPDSPAESAGVRVGDVILAFDGVATEDARHLPRQVAAARPDRETAMEIWRDGDRQRLKVRPGRLPGEQASAPEATPAVDGPRLGVTVAALDGGQRSRLTLDETVNGVLVVAVEPDSDAARQGLRSGDVIVRADRQPVAEPEALAEIVREAASEQREELLLLVNRRGSQRFVTVRLG